MGWAVSNVEGNRARRFLWHARRLARPPTSEANVAADGASPQPSWTKPCIEFGVKVKWLSGSAACSPWAGNEDFRQVLAFAIALNLGLGLEITPIKNITSNPNAEKGGVWVCWNRSLGRRVGGIKEFPLSGRRFCSSRIRFRARTTRVLTITDEYTPRLSRSALDPSRCSTCSTGSPLRAHRCGRGVPLDCSLAKPHQSANGAARGRNSERGR